MSSARVDPGFFFFLAGGAPLTNAATDGWHKQVLKVNMEMKAWGNNMILTAENTKQIIQMQILCICEVILESCRSSQGGGLYTSFTPFLDLPLSCFVIISL